MNNRIFIFLILSTFLLAERGDLINVQVMATKDLLNNQGYIDNELSTLAGDSFFNLTVEYGFWLYNITYETIDKYGNPIEASGVIAYPRVDWPELANQAFPTLSYQHGTVLEKNNVTSMSGLWVLPALIAGYGYVYVEPDYLGLGISEGLHPYHIKELYASDVVDILRATKQFSDESDQFQVNDQLFLAGYSEGGYATMATHQIIERDYVDEFDITVSFPMAGAYDMSGIMTNVMLNYTPYGQPFYFPYVLFSFCDNYQATLAPIEDYLLPEYANTLPELFDGMHSGDEINNIMPSIPITIMKPDSIESFSSDQTHPLRLALQENDIYDWTPQSPMYIFHGEADELVPHENAELAYEHFIGNGANDIYLEILPSNLGGHQDAAPFALLGAFTVAEELKIINELGDINQDGLIDVLDIIATVNIIINEAENSYQLWASDLNEDDSIDIFDIILLVDLIILI